MEDKVICDKSDLVNIADAVRSKLGVTDTYYVSELSSAIQNIQTGGITPSGTISITENGTVDVSQYANADVNVSATPSLQSKSVTYTENGTATITPDAGYDGLNSVGVTVNVGGASPNLQTKTATPSTSSQSITPDDGYDGLSEVTVDAMPSGSLNSPTISSSGLVTASVGTSGYLANGTNKTLQLTTQASKTVTPGTSNQTAVASGRYTTGAVTVKGDSNLVASNIKSGVSIFGVSGTLEEGLYQTTTSTITNNSTNRTLTIQNLGFPIYSRSNIVSLSIELISDSPDDLTAIAWHYNYYSNYIACCIFDNSGTNEYWENTYSGGSYYIINCNGSNIEVGFTSSANLEFSSGTYKYTLVVKKE